MKTGTRAPQAADTYLMKYESFLEAFGIKYHERYVPKEPAQVSYETFLAERDP